MNTRHIRKKKKFERSMQYCRFASLILKFPMTHEVCREFNSYLKLRPFLVLFSTYILSLTIITIIIIIIITNIYTG